MDSILSSHPDKTCTTALPTTSQFKLSYKKYVQVHSSDGKKGKSKKHDM